MHYEGHLLLNFGSSRSLCFLRYRGGGRDQRKTNATEEQDAEDVLKVLKGVQRRVEKVLNTTKTSSYCLR
jgi:hypothetical protein